ncbi:MAG: glypican [Synechococcaceae cyanobacterium]|nr:glypican [Synechococcaceae cyanobacterium]
MIRPLPQLRPLPASLALVSMAVGAVVLVGVGTVLLVPLVVLIGMVAAWVLAALLLVWAGIEALAAFERWVERDSRFQR